MQAAGSNPHRGKFGLDVANSSGVAEAEKAGIISVGLGHGRVGV